MAGGALSQLARSRVGLVVALLVVLPLGARLSYSQAQVFFATGGDRWPLSVGQKINSFLEDGDRILALTPMEAWYAGGDAYLWSLISGADEFARLLQGPASPALVVVAPEHPWHLRVSWQEGYVPFIFKDADRQWVFYFRPDKAESLAARDPAFAASLSALRSTPQGSFLRTADNPAVSYLDNGLRLQLPDLETMRILRLQASEVRVIDKEALDALPVAGHLPPLAEGALFSGPDRRTYVVRDGIGRPVADRDVPAFAPVFRLPDALLERIRLE
jgi:hypothetical protein